MTHQSFHSSSKLKWLVVVCQSARMIPVEVRQTHLYSNVLVVTQGPPFGILTDWLCLSINKCDKKTMTSIPLFAKYSLNSYNGNGSCIDGSVDDGDFGPVSKQCGDAFDLTLRFEQSFLSIAPSAIFLLIFAFRIWYLLRHRTRKARRNTIWALKLVRHLRSRRETCSVTNVS